MLQYLIKSENDATCLCFFIINTPKGGTNINGAMVAKACAAAPDHPAGNNPPLTNKTGTY